MFRTEFSERDCRLSDSFLAPQEALFFCPACSLWFAGEIGIIGLVSIAFFFESFIVLSRYEFAG